MGATWEQVSLLRVHRVAHRDLRRANVVLDRDATPWVIGLRFAELAADEALLRADVAHLLASFAVAAGAERTVRSAVEALGPEVVGAALSRLQRTALHSSTQHALRAQKGLLEELQGEVVRQCGVQEIQYEQLARVSGRSVFTVVMLAAVTYFLVPQFADLPGIVDQIRDANWWWLPPMLLASFLTYVGATIAVAGAVPDRLPLGPNLLTQAASSFTGTLAPAGIGGMAVNVRFLQKQGIDQPVAVSSIGLNTAAGAVGHLAMLLVFAIWAGDDAFETFRFPDPTVFVAVGGGLLALGAVGLAIPAGRRVAAQRLVPLAARSLRGVSDVVQRPRKLLALMGGSVLVTSCYLVSVYFGVQAFGGGLGFATIGACYLLGSAVASAAPTPGGLGAMEAALIAALVAAGLDNAAAVPAVFLYRFTTFWVPILPGWLSFTYLRRSDFL
jgi:undecaprenyl-diphosphatase